jgi:hypothetical protein
MTQPCQAAGGARSDDFVVLESLTIAPLERARLARSLAAIDEAMLLLELRYADNARGSVLQLERLRREICETVEQAWRSDAISH